MESRNGAAELRLRRSKRKCRGRLMAYQLLGCFIIYESVQATRKTFLSYSVDRSRDVWYVPGYFGTTTLLEPDVHIGEYPMQ